MMKNLMDFSIGSLGYWLIGFGLMFGVTTTGWFGTDGFLFQDFAKDGDTWLFAFLDVSSSICSNCSHNSIGSNGRKDKIC